MPQIVLFKRRWRASTDALPVLALLLGLTHAGFFVTLVTLSSILGGSEYQCNMKDEIRTVLFGLLAIVCLLIIDDAVVFFAGLRGGPFEEKRRRPVVFGMYCQFALIVVFTAFTIYGTVFASSDKAEKECWSRSPCTAIQSVVPESCLGLSSLGRWAGETGALEPLTPACQQLNILYAKDHVDRCVTNYMDLAGQYGSAVYNESARGVVDGVRTGPFNKGVIESAVSCRLRPDLVLEVQSSLEAAASTGVSVTVGEGGFREFNATKLLNDAAENGTLGFGIMNTFFIAFIEAVQTAEAEGFDPSTVAYKAAESAAQFFPNFMANIGVLLLGPGYGIIDPATPYLLGQIPLPANYTGLLMRAPWYQQCAATSLRGCEDVFSSTCNQWDLVLSIDDSHDEKGLFYAALGVAWGSIGLSILIYYLSFNSFADYESDEAWIALVNKVGGVLGWTSILRNSVTEAGFTASEELGLLLKRIFGGIDMDLTDRLLGAYLAGERRDWRRLRTVVSKLDAHGYSMKKQSGCLCGLFDGGGIDGYGLNELRSMVDSSLGVARGLKIPGIEENDRTVAGTDDDGGNGVGNNTVATNTDSTAELVPNVDAISLPSLPQCILPTPFDQESTAMATGDGSSQLDPSIEVAYSFVRLDSSVTSLGLGKKRNSRASRRGKHLEDALSGGIKDDTKVGIACVALCWLSRLPPIAHIPIFPLRRTSHEPFAHIYSCSLQAIKVMVPVDLSKISFDPPINSREAARIYLDDNLGIVPTSALQEALRYSRFSRAAYGLQTKLWKAGGKVSGNSGTANCVDGILSSRCFPKLLRSAFDVEERFKKRNFDAILKLTGIPPEDFLYVSYSNTTFGKLPFLVMLDRANRKVIVSIRGTAGLEDLITDLLSNPVDMNGMLPQSVLDALPPKTTVYGHAGIMSSAKAMVATLNDEGILQTIDTHVSSTDGPDETGPKDARESTGARVEEQSRAFSKHVSSLKADMNVEFSLERAQTAVFDAIFVQDYDIIITGHSLGAAVASIISVVLKEKYPSLKCFAFNPPGGIISPALSQLAAPYITSVVVGFDAISRLGLKNVTDLVDDMVFSLCRCKRPKLKIAMDVILSNRKDPLTAPKTYCSFDDVDDDVRQIIVDYMAASLVHKEVHSQELVPVGTIVFLRPYIQDGGAVEWDAVHASAGDIVNEGILVTKLALAHHRFHCTMSALEFCIDERETAQREER